MQQDKGTTPRDRASSSSHKHAIALPYPSPNSDRLHSLHISYYLSARF
ncbi:hypothetical protein [Dactylococcopsis salina]|nr:hypothetical protein [Dactylococcopsis salina]